MSTYRIYEVLRIKRQREMTLPGLDASAEAIVKKAWQEGVQRFEQQKLKTPEDYSDEPIQYELWTAFTDKPDLEGGELPVTYLLTEEYHALRVSLVTVEPGKSKDDAIGVRWRELSQAFDLANLSRGYIAPYRLELWRAILVEDAG